VNITRLFQRVASLPGLSWLSSREANSSTGEIRFIPQRNQILGTQVEITTTVSGIVLPDQQGMKASIFVLIESVGPDVRGYKPGDIVLPYKSNQIFLRGGYHRLILEDKEVLAVAENLPLDRLSVGGKPLKAMADGKFSLPAVQSAA